ncbi:MAG: hypothetical protein ACJA09_000234 [Alcanivorax sp.]|jgi:hypothetical protein
MKVSKSVNWPIKAILPNAVARSALAMLVIVITACSSQSPTHRAPHSLSELDRGICPPQIISTGGSGFSSQRYGSTLSNEQLSNYQRHELENCGRKVATGDPRALQALVQHWTSDNRADNVAASYELYVANGRNRERLAEASATLYQMYRDGQGNLTANEDAAFKYLELAVRYGVTTYGLTYADALHQRALYKDAFPYYSEIANGAAATGGSKGYSAQQVCEVDFQMADHYFHGRGVEENWYLGYYYWRRAQQQAANPEWGSCIRDNFAFQERYKLESERLGPAQKRIAKLSLREREEIEEALGKSTYRGLATVSAMPFVGQHIPVAAASPSKIISHGPVKSAPAATMSNNWTPLSASICKLSGGGKTLPWSDIFELRSPTIWTLTSNDGKETTLGSAVAVARNRLITNCHMINSPAKISLRQGTQRLSAFLSSADPEGDRCILQVAQPLPGYVISARESKVVRIGEDVAAIGNPKGLDTSLSRGIIAQKRQKSGRAYLQTDAALSSGSSGGGLFDAEGNLVGITTFTVAAGENLNFAIAVEEFCRE